MYSHIFADEINDAKKPLLFGYVHSKYHGVLHFRRYPQYLSETLIEPLMWGLLGQSEYASLDDFLARRPVRVRQ
jgi:hypothetical protein